MASRREWHRPKTKLAEERKKMPLKEAEPKITIPKKISAMSLDAQEDADDIAYYEKSKGEPQTNKRNEFYAKHGYRYEQVKRWFERRYG